VSESHSLTVVTLSLSLTIGSLLCQKSLLLLCFIGGCCLCLLSSTSCRSVPEALILLKRLMFAPENPTDGFVNKTTVKYFTTAYNLTQSSRALGWDTNDYTMNTYRGCANMSALTFTHTGYTGTTAKLCVGSWPLLPLVPVMPN
jgi:hypothetical protein